MIIANIQLGKDVFIHPSASFNNVIIGDKVRIAKDCTVVGSEGHCVKIGSNTWITMFTIIDGQMADIEIGANASIGQQCIIVSNWGIAAESKLSKLFPVKAAPIKIGENSWVGSSCVIAPGVTIGRCCIIASNSYVASDVPDFSVYGGSPAKLIRQLDPKELE